MTNSYHGVITERRIHPILMGDSPPADVEKRTLIHKLHPKWHPMEKPHDNHGALHGFHHDPSSSSKILKEYSAKKYDCHMGCTKIGLHPKSSHNHPIYRWDFQLQTIHFGDPPFMKKKHILPRGTEVACSMLSIFCRNFNLCCWMLDALVKQDQERVLWWLKTLPDGYNHGYPLVN